MSGDPAARSQGAEELYQGALAESQAVLAVLNSAVLAACHRGRETGSGG